MSATPWSQLTLCAQSDIDKRVKGLPFAAKDDARFKASCAEKMDEIKERIEKRILIWLKTKYPNETEQWVSSWMGYVRSSRQRINAEYSIVGDNTIVQTMGDQFVDFNEEDFLENAKQVNPRTFFKSGPPATNDFQNIAPNGAYYVDLDAEDLYINRGSLSAPNWALFNIKSLIDFILNPEQLRIPAVSGVIWLLLEEGSLKLQAAQNASYEVIDKTVPRWVKYFETDLSDALQLLEIDASGDGIISNYERETQTTTNTPF